MKDRSGTQDRTELKAYYLKLKIKPCRADHVGICSLRLLKASSSCLRYDLLSSLPQDECPVMRIKYFSLSHGAVGASDAGLKYFSFL